MRGIALYCLHQIGHEVIAFFALNINIRPRGFYCVSKPDKPVIDGNDSNDQNGDDDEDDEQGHCFSSCLQIIL
jgi:hypothetical protein